MANELGRKAMLSFQETLVLQKQFFEQIKKLDALKKQIDEFRPISFKRLDKILQKMRLDWNYHSNAIEGNSLTKGETETFLMHGFTAKGKPFKDYEDIRGHDNVVKYLNEIVGKPEIPISHQLLSEIHQIIIPEGTKSLTENSQGSIVHRETIRGKYKTQSNHVRTQTDEIHYYCEPALTHSEMTNLLDWLKLCQENNVHPLITSAIFHHRFVEIHPFDDGNGRMTRAISNLILMRAGFPIIVIKAESGSSYLEKI